MLATAAFDQHVLARLLDFFSDRTAWQRTLWSSGTALSLKELVEASDQLATGVVGQVAMAHYAHCVEIAALRDFGVGDEKRRKLLGSLLRTDDRNKTLAANGFQYKSIEHLIPEIAFEYLRRWSDTLIISPQPAKPERAARSIAAHLLDCGFHPQFLHKWWTYKAKYEPGTRTPGGTVAGGRCPRICTGPGLRSPAGIRAGSPHRCQQATTCAMAEQQTGLGVAQE